LSLAPGSGDPYVQLKLDGQEAQTTGVKGVTTQGGTMFKWLKDFKLQAPEKSGNLQVVVKQDDTALGSVAIPVGPVADAGTQVQWFKIRSRDDKVAGEICLVLRLINKGAGSATKAGAARQTSSERTPAKSAASPRSPRRSPGASPARNRPSGEGRPSGRVSGDSRSPVRARPDRSDRPDRPDRKPPVAVAASSSAARDRTKRSSKLDEGAAKARGGGAKGGGGGIFSRLPLVGAVVAALGVVTLLSNKPKFYEIQEGDTICAVGFCFNRSSKDILKKNPQVVDPDKIFPGDRIRID